MKIKVSELVKGQVFRFPLKPQEYVVIWSSSGDICCTKIESYDSQKIPSKSECLFFALKSYFTVEVPPYSEIQLTLF